MSSEVALSVRGLSKAYTITRNQQRYTTAREALLHKLKNPLDRAETEIFWALKDVSFELRKGDVVGVIGRNGAGKSTLLKVLSQITEPTQGEIRLYGPVGSLLEVGTGFHPELTGRENIFLNGAILGMTKSEITRQFDAIVEFSGVERFLETPVKRYSSGMYVRLAFAVAAHLNTDILIVDEVLAVGDANFQKKCLGKMQDVAQAGRTVLFVSHNMAAIKTFCRDAILLEQGKLSLKGTVGECLAAYAKDAHVALGRVVDHAAEQSPDVKVRWVTVNGSQDDFMEMEDMGGPLHIEMDVEVLERCTVALQVWVKDEFGSCLGIFSPAHKNGSANIYRLPPGYHRIKAEVEMPLLNKGNYYLDIALTEPDVQFHARFRSGLKLQIEGKASWTGVMLDQSTDGHLFISGTTSLTSHPTSSATSARDDRLPVS
jgi:lipopolysaccharide transport system ATP-binding protein